MIWLAWMDHPIPMTKCVIVYNKYNIYTENIKQRMSHFSFHILVQHISQTRPLHGAIFIRKCMKLPSPTGINLWRSRCGTLCLGSILETYLSSKFPHGVETHPPNPANHTSSLTHQIREEVEEANSTDGWDDVIYATSTLIPKKWNWSTIVSR